jgi:MscS family membrane protein
MTVQGQEIGYIHSFISQLMHDDIKLIQLSSIVILTIIFGLYSKRLFRHLVQYFQKTQYLYDDLIVQALAHPVTFGVWFFGCYWFLYFLGVKVNLLIQAKEIFLLVILVWFMVRFISSFEERLEKRIHQGVVHINRTTLRALSQLFRIIILLIALLIGLEVFGVPISGVLAFGGIGGVGIAFASKDLLANFFGGLMIYLDRPFEVGDWIRSPDQEIEGTVEHIGWRLTRIRTFDQRPRYVPNSVFSIITMDNPSRMRNRRIKTLVGLRYQDSGKVAEIIEAVKAMLHQHEEIDTRRILLVSLVEFGPSSLNFQVYTFTKTVDWAHFMSVQQDVLLKIIEVIHAHGADCAFPTQTLHLAEPDQSHVETLLNHESDD